jgi:molecular chaperone GrpE
MDEDKPDTEESSKQTPEETPDGGSADGETSDDEEDGPGPELQTREKEAGEADEEQDEPAPEPEEKAQASDELLKTRERMLRIAADYENYRKRAKRDVEEAERKARVDVLKEILPVFDNLARAVEHGSEVQDAAPIIQGAQMVSRQFEENLEKFGLKRIESVGKPFDPSMHDAISQEVSDEAEPGTVIKEFLAGYMLGDRLLRAAMVVVAKAGPAGDDEPPDDAT